MHKHLFSNYFPWKTRVGKINQYWTNAIQVTKGPVISESIQEKKEKEDLLLLSWKISPRPRNQKKKLRNHNKQRMVKFWSGLTFTNMYYHTLQGLVVAAVTLNQVSKLSSTPFLSVADIFLFLFFRPLTTLLAILSSNLATFTSHESLEAFPKQIHS